MFQMKVTGYKIEKSFFLGELAYIYIYLYMYLYIYIYTDTYADSLPAGLAETIAKPYHHIYPNQKWQLVIHYKWSFEVEHHL